MSKAIEEGARYRHKTNGHYYKIVALALNESDSARVVVYRAEVTKVVWVRPMEEFEEKFERVKW